MPAAGWIRNVEDLSYVPEVLFHFAPCSEFWSDSCDSRKRTYYRFLVFYTVGKRLNGINKITMIVVSPTNSRERGPLSYFSLSLAREEREMF